MYISAVTYAIFKPSLIIVKLQTNILYVVFSVGAFVYFFCFCITIVNVLCSVVIMSPQKYVFADPDIWRQINSIFFFFWKVCYDFGYLFGDTFIIYLFIKLDS